MNQWQINFVHFVNASIGHKVKEQSYKPEKVQGVVD